MRKKENLCKKIIVKTIYYDFNISIVFTRGGLKDMDFLIDICLHPVFASYTRLFLRAFFFDCQRQSGIYRYMKFVSGGYIKTNFCIPGKFADA